MPRHRKARRPHSGAERWTWRRVPGRVARGLAVAALVAVCLFIGHVAGWGTLGRFDPSIVWIGLIFGLPIAALASFGLGAPMLRRAALAGRLSRVLAVRLAALFYGGLVFLWMALLRPGPPDELVLALIESGWTEAAIEALGVAYRHVLTPLVFGLYGAVAGYAGWWAAFGGRPAAPESFAG